VHKNKLLLFAAIFFSFAFTNCTKKAAQNPNVKAKQSIPQRIVSLSPASTEILFAVGAENQIVAVSDFSDYPPQAQNLPKVGGFDGKTLSLEAIFAHEPDLVYLTNVMHNFLIPQLEANKIDYYISYGDSVEGVKNEILEIGKLTGHEAESQKVVEQIDQDLNFVKTKNILASAYWEVWNAPFMSAGKKSFINDLLGSAGIKNIFDDIDDAYPIVSEETIILRQPELILIPKNSGLSVDAVNGRKGWEDIPAVKNGKVFIVDDDLLTRAGPRMGQSVKELYSIAQAVLK
jgi:iron complex transport system substrate-binding protein